MPKGGGGGATPPSSKGARKRMAGKRGGMSRAPKKGVAKARPRKRP